MNIAHLKEKNCLYETIKETFSSRESVNGNPRT